MIERGGKRPQVTFEDAQQAYNNFMLGRPRSSLRRVRELHRRAGRGSQDQVRPLAIDARMLALGLNPRTLKDMGENNPYEFIDTTYKEYADRIEVRVIYEGLKRAIDETMEYRK